MFFIQRRELAAILMLGWALSQTACDRNAARVRELEEENARLEKALAAYRGSSGVGEAHPEKVDLDLTIPELWVKRFEETEIRARKQLDQKRIRVTAQVGSVTDHSVTLIGVAKGVGSVSLVVQFDDSYSRRVGGSLAALRAGAVVTVQGRFSFKLMSMEDAFLVNRSTGQPLEAAALASLEAADETPPTPGAPAKEERSETPPRVP